MLILASAALLSATERGFRWDPAQPGNHRQTTWSHSVLLSVCPGSDFPASIPPLSHLCRLEIRAILRSERLRSDHFIRELPLPACLQDYLLYLDVLRVNGIPEAEDYLGQREEGAATSHPTAEDAERRDTCATGTRWWCSHALAVEFVMATSRHWRRTAVNKVVITLSTL